jgi:hypothetical protein
MSFPTTSNSVETGRIGRAIKVMQRHRRKSRAITQGEVYNCKMDSATLWSAHAFGDAVDLMCDQGAVVLKEIADAAIKDATKRTIRNRGKRTEVDFVIYETTQWTRANGFQPYTGIPHTNHVHVACSYSVPLKPECGGGSNYNVVYLHGQRGTTPA